MEINIISGPGDPPRSLEGLRKRMPTEGMHNPLAFQASGHIEAALAATPDVRNEEVARASKLVSLVEYPPAELIEKISLLLARHWDDALN